MTRFKSSVLAIAIAILLSGCNSSITNSTPESTLHTTVVEIETTTEDNPIEETTADTDRLTDKEKVDLSLNPNEAGRVMVLMYHSIGETDSAWEITPDSFRADLEYMYTNGYRPISLSKYVKGQIDTPAGYTPIILTFDDANQNNFNLIEENGELLIDPDSALGIMQEFNKKYEDFNVTASFYIYGTNAFRQQQYVEYKLQYLVDNGFDVGNHTYGHARLIESTTSEEVQYQIGMLVAYVNGILPDYEMNTFVIPYGQRPKGDLNDYLVSGEYNGVSYDHIAVLEVGSHPTYSVFDARFDYTSIPRIRASNTEEHQESADWFEYFEKNPHLRFVSDGFENVVTVPQDMLELIDTDDLGDKSLLVY
ncbi:MAG: polysaccharide deacetylase family protein [Eubacteriales bacterium]|nr:polysaccharide deacetylase family protein [Eubacteriales bacterium]